jgi:hypothetical protein
MSEQTDTLTRLVEEFPEVGLFAAEVRDLVRKGRIVIEEKVDGTYLILTIANSKDSERYICLQYELEPEDPDEPWLDDDLVIYFWDDYFHYHLDDLAHNEVDEWKPTEFRDMLRALVANKATLYTSLAPDGTWNGSWIKFHDEYGYLDDDIGITPSPDYDHSLRDGVRVSVTNWDKTNEEAFRIIKESPAT